AVAELVVDGLQGAVVPPLIEVAPDGAPGREVLGQVAPLAAGPQDVEGGVEDVAHRRLARPAAGVYGDQALDQAPLLIGQVAGVSLGSHTPFYGLAPPLSDRQSAAAAVQHRHVARAAGRARPAAVPSSGQWPPAETPTTPGEPPSSHAQH